jgi:transcription termination/antitermination protein NusG
VNDPSNSGDLSQDPAEAEAIRSAPESLEPTVEESVETSDVSSVESESSDDDVDGMMIEEVAAPEDLPKDWFILKIQVNRETSIRDALIRRIKIEGLEGYFGDIVVPTEDVAEFNKSGKRRIVKRKLYPGYLLVNMAITDDTWFLVRETPGVGDFTGSGGKPTPMDVRDVERILKLGAHKDDGGKEIKTAIPFRIGDRVRVKDGNFQNFEGDVESMDEANGRITVVITIFNRSTPVELEHWQLESV